MTAKAKRNLLLRVLIYGGLLTAAVIALRMRACPTWTPAAVTETYQTRKPNPYIDPEGQTQETRILPPEGFARTEAAEGSFTAFMRQQPVYGDGSMIYVYDGSQRSGAGAAAGALTFTFLICMGFFTGSFSSTSKGLPLTVTLAMLPSMSSISTL